MFELCNLVFEVSDVLAGVSVVQLALHLPFLLLKRDKQQYLIIASLSTKTKTFFNQETVWPVVLQVT